MALNTIDWLIKNCQSARWDIVSRAMDVLYKGYAKELTSRTCLDCSNVYFTSDFERGKRGRRKICRKCKSKRDQMRRYQKRYANTNAG